MSYKIYLPYPTTLKDALIEESLMPYDSIVWHDGKGHGRPGHRNIVLVDTENTSSEEPSILQMKAADSVLAAANEVMMRRAIFARNRK